MVSIKLPAKDKQETFEAKYFLKLGQHFGNFTTGSFLVWPHICLSKVSKIFAQFKKIFNFKKFLIYFLLNA